MKTLIAAPCMDMVHTTFMCSFLDLEKPEGTVYTITRNTLIYTARNTIADQAIDGGYDRVLWLDSDMTFEPDTLLKLSADIDAGCDFVCGLYFSRKQPIRPVFYKNLWWNVSKEGLVDTGCEIFRDYPKDSVFEIAGAGFGCVMTSTELLRKVRDKYGSPFAPLMGMGEDLTFCWRVKQTGGKMFCDSRVKCGHTAFVTVNENTYLHQGLRTNAH